MAENQTTPSPSSSSSVSITAPIEKRIIIEVPNGKLSNIIGISGRTLENIRFHSGGAKIEITADIDVDPNSATRTVQVVGTPDQVSKAEALILSAISPFDSILPRRGVEKNSPKSPIRIPIKPINPKD